MIPDSQRRFRPMTANFTKRKKNKNDLPPLSATNARRRRAVSAKVRVQSAPADLNPPEWPPLISDLYPEDTETQTKLATPENHPDSEAPVVIDDSPSPLHFKEMVRMHVQKSRSRTESIEEKDQCARLPENMMSPRKSVQPPSSGNVRTRDDLKRFLSAAMDSVRFFLVTSSIGQAKKKDQQKEKESDDDEEEESEEDEKDFIIPRSELIIKNAALTDKPWRFSIETYRDDPKMLEYYTGFKSYELIQSIFKLVKPTQETIEQWEESETEGRFRDGAFRSGILTLFNEFFMFLFKLRHNLDTEDLAVRFCMAESLAETILNDWIHYLYTCFGKRPVWASRDNTDIFMPMCFKSLSPCARIVIHVARISVRVPFEMQNSVQIPAQCGKIGSQGSDANQSKVETSVEETKEETPMTKNKDEQSPIVARKNELRSQKSIDKTGESVSKQKSKSKKRIAVLRNTFHAIRRQKAVTVKDVDTKTEVSDEVKTVESAEQPTASNNVHDKDGKIHYKSMVIFQPTGAAAFIGKLYPVDYKTENILQESGVLELLEECDDIITLDPRDELDACEVEELLHPYAVNYLNSQFLRGHMSMEELEARSPLKAHRLKCMHWHVYQSVEWIEGMKIWDELAEWSETWVRNVERIWTISCLLSNFLPADPCLDVGTI